MTTEPPPTDTSTSPALAGRVALVTGASRGIGRGIAERLVAAGASVVNGDITGPDEAVTGCRHMPLDVTDPTSVADTLHSISTVEGRLDIVVNNAGIMFEEPLDGHDLDAWHRMVAINLTGPFLVTRAATPLLARRGGSVVNVGSIEGYSANPGHVAYGATKGGVHGMTNAMAVDLGPSGIRVNAVAPGWIDTELNASFVDRHPDRDEVVRQLAVLHPVGHIGAPSDVGDVVTWLASDAARFVTGQVITVDGGRLAKPPLPPIMG